MDSLRNLTVAEVIEICSTLSNGKFTFIDNQAEVVTQIFNNLQNNQRQLLIAPTGSGKSFIAFALSMLYSHEYSAKTFVVTNTKQLQEQYVQDASKLTLKFGNISGLDNYKCHVNNSTYALGHCSSNLGYRTIEQKQTLDCFAKCEYLQSRDAAIKSPLAITNYNYWLIQQNYVKLRHNNYSFANRLLTIFDECHSIPDIVQNHFAVNLNTAYVSGILHESANYNVLTASMINHIMHIINKIHQTNDTNEIQSLLKSLYNNLQSSKTNFDKLISKFQDSYKPENHKENASMHYVMSLYDKIKDLYCKIEDYIELIDTYGNQYIVKDSDNTSWSKFRFANDIALIALNIHKHTKHSLFMTATAGNADILSNVLALGKDKYDVIELNSTWSFDKSPIYYDPSNGKMTYHHKHKNENKLLNSISSIVKQHSLDNGLIHSRSYDLTKSIVDSLKNNNSHVILSHNNAQERIQSLNKHKQLNNKSIIISPSMHEGVNFNDDYARFMILCKMPYINPHDKLTKRRQKFMPEWIELNNAIHVIQSLGRPIRHSKDYCTTYLLDRSFGKELANICKHFAFVKHRLKIKHDILQNAAAASNIDGFTAIMSLHHLTNNETAYFSKVVNDDNSITWFKHRISRRFRDDSINVDVSKATYIDDICTATEEYVSCTKMSLDHFINEYCKTQQIISMHSPFFTSKNI
jgi:Rad3-related DNA helicase